jgi:hypothetical protein
MSGFQVGSQLNCGGGQVESAHTLILTLKKQKVEGFYF